MQAVNPALSPADIRAILVDSPYTCERCDDRAFLQADDAVARARDAASPSAGAPADASADPPDGASGDDGADEAACDPSRGNWDCPAGTGCRDGVCAAGVQGRARLGEGCTVDDDCNSGLCDRPAGERGECTKPCDSGCPAGDTCEPGVIPGGLCRAPAPESCAASGADGFAALALAAIMRRRRRPRA